jgi:acetyl-CoA acetyltransferase
MKLRNVVLVDGARSAFARGGRGKLVATRLDEAGAKVIRGLLEKNPKVKDTMVQDIGLGNVGGSGEFVGLAHVGRLAGLPLEVSAFNTNRQCGSSMDTLHRIAQAIMVGALDCGIALGIERMGASLGGGGGARKSTRVTQFNRRALDMNEAQRKMSPDHNEYFSVPFPDYILNSPPLQSMTQTAQNVAETYGLTREELDQFAAESHQKTAAAQAKGI